MVQLPLNTKLEEVIFAMTLGDGHMRIQEKSINAYMEISHSLKQEDYLKYKVNLLNLYGNFNHTYSLKKVNMKNKIYNLCKVYIYANEHFTNVYNKMYTNNTKKLTTCLELFNETTLSLLFMDDGSAKIKKRIKRKDGSIINSEKGFIEAFMLATNGFSFEECHKLVEHLNYRFGIKATVQRDRDKPRIAISNLDSKIKFLQIVSPYIEQVPSLKYKIDKPLSMKDANFI